MARKIQNKGMLMMITLEARTDGNSKSKGDDEDE